MAASEHPGSMQVRLHHWVTVAISLKGVAPAVGKGHSGLTQEFETWPHPIW